MKKYFNKLSILLASTCIALTSCDALELAPQDYFAEGNFWKNEAQVNSSMIGMHAKMRDKYYTFFWLGEGRNGMQSLGPGTQGPSFFWISTPGNTMKPTSVEITQWGGLYSIIFDANLLIEKVTPMDETIMTKAKKDIYLAQAYGLRAYCYFILMKTYGGVPLVLEPKVLTSTDPTTLNKARATVDETIAQITADIDKSDALYATDNFSLGGRYFWNKAATKMLKGEVYLWAAKVGKSTPDAAKLNVALEALQSIPADKYSLQKNFIDVFAYGQKANSEIILAMNFHLPSTQSAEFGSNWTYASQSFPTGDYNSRDGKVTLYDTLELKGPGIQRQEFMWEFFEFYEDADSRKRTNFLDYYALVQAKDAADKPIFEDGPIGSDGKPTKKKVWEYGDDGLPKIANKGICVRKYLGTLDASGVRKFVDDIIYYRYADVVLMIAEIKNGLGQDPSDEINQIRQRAYRDKDGKDMPYPIYTNQDFAANELAIYGERLKEFTMEGKSWYDLLRMKAANGDPLVYTPIVPGLKAPLDKATQSHMLVWPIGTNVTTYDRLVIENPHYPLF